MSFFSGLLQGAGVIGSLFGAGSASRESRMAREQQAREFEYQKWLNANQVQMRVKDAQAAGVHPLYALNPTGASFSPSVPIQGDTGSFLNEAGQNLSRAASASMDRRERAKLLMHEAQQSAIRDKREGVLFDQQITRNELENRLLLSRIKNLDQPGTGPAMPSPQSVPDGTTVRVPARSTSPNRGEPASEAGTIRDWGYADTGDGGMTVVPSYDVHERMEDNIFQQWGWELRNGFIPQAMGDRGHRPNLSDYPLPVGQRWEWDIARGAYYPQDIRTGRFIRR